jgi:hypothetical protein
MYIGDFDAGSIVDFKFCTVGTTGAPTVLAGTPSLSVYKNNGTTESAAGVTLTVSFDGVIGLNHVRIDTSADGTFYANGNDFQISVAAGTVGGTSVVGYILAHFSLRNRGVTLRGITHTGAVIPTVSTLSGHTAQSGDTYARLGAPAGASIAEDISSKASQSSVTAVDDFVDTEIADIQSRLPAALVGGRMDSSVGAVAANAITDAAVASDMDSYIAKVWVIKESTTTDHYAVAWFKNNVRITSGITSPTIQVIKGSDGTDLVAATALTEIGSTHRFKKDESTNKLVGGQIYFAVVSATIDGSTRTWDQQIGRDSS